MAELKVHARPCDIERMVQNEEIRQEFSRRLKTAVARAGHAEWGVGARLSEVTGATAKAASKWLNAESMPGRANMLAIAEWLGVRVEWLQYGEGEPHQPATPPESADQGRAAPEPDAPVDICDDQIAELLGKLRDAKKKASPRSQAVISRMIGLAERAVLDDAAWKLIDDLLTELSKK